MSRLIKTVLRESTDLRPTDRAVLLAVAAHANADGADAWPSFRTIAELAGVSPRTAQRSVCRLVNGGRLTISYQSRGRVSNRYRVACSNHATVTRSTKNATASEQPANHDSAPRGTTQKTRSEDPKPPTPKAAPSPARHVLMALPAGWERISKGEQKRLAPLVAAALAAGWSADALVSKIAAGSADEVRSVYGVLRHRLANIGKPIAAPGGAALPPPASAAKCSRHVGQFAAHCAPCRSEVLAGER